MPLPVQALDHAAGHLLAAAALRGMSLRLATGRGTLWRGSLARVASLLVSLQLAEPGEMAPMTDADFSQIPEPTHWGAALRLRPPCGVSDAPMRWYRPATALGTSQAVW
jgi:hypothetical protein